MKIKNIVIIGLLMLFVVVSANAQSLAGKSATELESMQKDALAKEDYDLAEKIKLQLSRLAENKGKIDKLEKEKETAILIEDYDRVIAIDKEIEALKSGKTYEEKSVTPVTVTPSPTPAAAPPVVQPVYNAQVNSNSSSFEEAKYDMSKKNIVNTGVSYAFGKIAIDWAHDFMFPSDYFRGGLYFTEGVDIDNDEVGAQFGMEVKALGDFKSVVLPYTAIGVGFGIASDDDGVGFGPSVIYKVGTYLFFSDKRGFGVYSEINLNTLYLDRFPLVRFGFAWSSVKTKYRYR